MKLKIERGYAIIFKGNKDRKGKIIGSNNHACIFFTKHEALNHKKELFEEFKKETKNIYHNYYIVPCKMII